MMKNAVRILTAALAASLLATAASAQSISPLAKKAEPIPVVAEGMAPLSVTSSVSDFGDKTALIFDGDLETSVKATYGEEDETNVFTIRAATGIPQALSAFALVTKSEDRTRLTVRVFGTNDSTETEWTPLTLHPPVVKTGEWHVFNLTEPEGGWEKAEKYAFYRIEIEITEGRGFTLGECMLIRPDLGEPELAYGAVESVEPGQTPPIVAVEKEEAEKPENPVRYRFGLNFPGLRK